MWYGYYTRLTPNRAEKEIKIKRKQKTNKYKEYSD